MTDLTPAELSCLRYLNSYLGASTWGNVQTQARAEGVGYQNLLTKRLISREQFRNRDVFRIIEDGIKLMEGKK